MNDENEIGKNAKDGATRHVLRFLLSLVSLLGILFWTFMQWRGADLIFLKFIEALTALISVVTSALWMNDGFLSDRSPDPRLARQIMVFFWIVSSFFVMKYRML